jgi:predicted nucleic acid-binding protein
MAAYYFDSSALVKRYAEEVGSPWVGSLMDSHLRHDIFTALVTGGEIVAAIARKARVGSIAMQEAKVTITVFRAHFKTNYLIVLTNTPVVERAMDLAEQHGLRGYDAIQLASALTVQAELNANGTGLAAFVSAEGVSRRGGHA